MLEHPSSCERAAGLLRKTPVYCSMTTIIAPNVRHTCRAIMTSWMTIGIISGGGHYTPASSPKPKARGGTTASDHHRTYHWTWGHHITSSYPPSITSTSSTRAFNLPYSMNDHIEEGGIIISNADGFFLSLFHSGPVFSFPSFSQKLRLKRSTPASFPLHNYLKVVPSPSSLHGTPAKGDVAGSHKRHPRGIGSCVLNNQKPMLQRNNKCCSNQPASASSTPKSLRGSSSG